MAGGVSKTLGLILTILGAAGLVLGLALATYAAVTIDGETQETFPDDRRAEESIQIGLAGLFAAGLAILVLFVGIPTLVWGFHRERDLQTGRTRTRRGGALAAWATSFLLLGALLVVVGGIAAAYGASLGSGGSPNPDAREARADFAEMLLTGGAVLAVVGAALLVVGLAFAIGAALRGRTVITEPGAASTGGPVREAKPASPVAVAAVVVLGVALSTLVVLAAVGEGPVSLDALDSGETTERTYSGHLRLASTPVGPVGVGPSEAQHEMVVGARRGYVSAELAWDDAAAGAPPRLLLVIAARDAAGDWIEIGTVEDGAPLAFPPTLTDVHGALRAYVTFPDGVSGDTDYELRLTVVNQ